jgi:formylglycine-generating enzyme required for sulfatase activity
MSGPVKSLCHAGLLLFALAAAAWSATEPGVDASIQQMLQIAEGGRFTHALRAVDMQLADHPDEPRLLAYRVQLLAALSEAKDEPNRLASRAEPPPSVDRAKAEPGHDFTCPTAEIPLIWIAPGTFLMSNPLGSDDDTLVTLTRGYWLGRTEVTQEQWQTVMEHVPAPSYFKGSDRPVERVTWTSAMEFTRRLTERERAAGRLPSGYEYTLPTEAQWEFACRAGTTTAHAGDLMAMAWFGYHGGRQTQPVAQKQPNAWGLYDMHGNVWEWCLDGYNGYPGGHATDFFNNYEGPSAAMIRIMRGGGYGNSAGQCRSAQRHAGLMVFTGTSSGFRLALAPVISPRTSAPETTILPNP